MCTIFDVFVNILLLKVDDHHSAGHLGWGREGIALFSQALQYCFRLRCFYFGQSSYLLHSFDSLSQIPRFPDAGGGTAGQTLRHQPDPSPNAAPGLLDAKLATALANGSSASLPLPQPNQPNG